MNKFNILTKLPNKLYLSFFTILFVAIGCNKIGNQLLSIQPFPGESAPPKVLFSNPISGADNLPTDQKFTIGFSKPMNMNQCQIAFSITPNTPGFFSHSDTTLTFSPSAALKPGTYVFAVTKSCEDLNGRDIQDPFSASISIGSAVTLGTSPTITGMYVYADTIPNCNSGVAPLSEFLYGSVNNACTGNPSTNQIILNFSRDMNQQLTQSAILFSPSLSAGFSWSSPTTLKITPDYPFSPGQRYTIAVGTQATDTNNIPLQGLISSSFFVPPASLSSEINSINVIAGTQPACFGGTGSPIDILTNNITNACLGNPTANTITFNFPVAMDPLSTQSAISFTPNIPGSYAWSAGNTVLTFTSDSTLTYSTRYTIGISTSAKTANLSFLPSPIQASFIAGANNPLPHVQAIGLVSQDNGSAGSCVATFPGTGSSTGGNWTSGSPCWWDDSLLVLSPSAYKFRGGDDVSYSATACTNRTTDDFRIIFTNYMNTTSVINALLLTRVSPGGSNIQLSTWNWNDCQITYPYGCRVLDLQFAESASSCGDAGSPATHFGTSGDFNLTNSFLTIIPLPANFPIYSLQITNIATDIENRQLYPAFNFSFVSQ